MECANGIVKLNYSEFLQHSESIRSENGAIFPFILPTKPQSLSLEKTQMKRSLTKKVKSTFLTIKKKSFFHLVEASTW